MDSKECVPDYRMKCSLDTLEKCLHELKEEVKKEGIAEIDFYYNNPALEKEFKKAINKYLWNNTIR